MQWYVEVVRKLTGAFTKFKVIIVLRSVDMQEDALRKLASMTFGHLSQKVLVNVLPKISIKTKDIKDLR